MEILNHLMIGPLVLVLSLLYKFIPSKIKLMSFSGADTFSDRKIILESMRYSSTLMIIASIFTTLFQMILLLGLDSLFSLDPLYAIPLSVAVLILSLIVVLLVTQQHLRKTFLLNQSGRSGAKIIDKQKEKADVSANSPAVVKGKFGSSKTQPAML